LFFYYYIGIREGRVGEEDEEYVLRGRKRKEMREREREGRGRRGRKKEEEWRGTREMIII
jgi:hypothetical protein